jgi:hypothetical protein
MANPVRYAILDSATDSSPLWELPWPLSHATDEGPVEIHPRRTMKEIRPVLVELLREGHVEIYPYREPEASALPLDDALAAISVDANWNPETTQEDYGVTLTESGERELRGEREEAHKGDQ